MTLNAITWKRIQLTGRANGTRKWDAQMGRALVILSGNWKEVKSFWDLHLGSSKSWKWNIGMLCYIRTGEQHHFVPRPFFYRWVQNCLDTRLLLSLWSDVLGQTGHPDTSATRPEMAFSSGVTRRSFVVSTLNCSISRRIACGCKVVI